MQTVDVLTFREDLKTSWQLIKQEEQPSTRAILGRFRDIENRINSTDDVNELQRLDAEKKFLKSIATHSDTKDLFIERMIKNFNAMDDAYWTGIINGQQIIKENAALREQVRILKVHKFILETGLKKHLRRNLLTSKAAA